MAVQDAVQNLTFAIFPEKISAIVQAGPAAVFLLIFIVVAYLFYSIRNKTTEQRVTLGIFYGVSLLALSGAYFLISKSEVIPDDAHMADEELAISQRFAKLTPSNKVTIPLFSKDWIVGFRARLDVRQALRYLQKT